MTNASLIIDKNAATRYDLKLLLWQFNFLTYECGNTSEAVTSIVSKGPGIIFISLQTIKDTGFDFIQQIKDLHSGLIIVYTDQVTKDDLMECIKAKVDHVLLNPSEQIERLRDIVTSALQSIAI
ncbi:response regulator receiver protein [Desulforamulus reducens MI-1]|uniref:Stage 0 sporulation protein A homolog n=1 Tax=Desulforamulus reducens (strain ATCC BAA-1160 / DSM 100696 / MI-1) TaxID=349161 RepID=A4J6W0_DESRM|nr:response regulator [Desulforamulus reducens]ABO50813.1 response regulator receiver protein [Desulforamulus reducens MI-1]